MKVNVRPRLQNSARQHDGRRFPAHLAWLRKRPCLVADKPGHDCLGKIEAHHVNEAGTRGLGQKVEDFYCVPVCASAHAAFHNRGWRTFQADYDVNLVAAAKDYARLSPHRTLWESRR